MKTPILKVLAKTKIFENNQAKTGNYESKRAAREAI